MFLVDSHCHLDLLDLSAFGGTLDTVIDNARAQGVDGMLCVSVSLEGFPHVLAAARPYDHVRVSVGVHPNEREGRDPSVEELCALARSDDKVVAIGETGLDYFRSEGDLDWQRQRFRRHIRAAKAARLPLIVHMREATEDTLAILAEEGAEAVGGVMHCFTGDLPTAQAAIGLGFYISFSGIVTFASAKALQQVAAQIPEDRLLLETDSPYLAPVPHRGKPNQPAYTRHTADFVARLRGVPLERLAAATTANFTRLFFA
jgi:TatD DNase family protein